MNKTINRETGMLEVGHSQRHVAGVIGVSQSTVARIWERFVTHGNARYRHGGCRKRVTTQREDRFIIVQARRRVFVSAAALQNDFQNDIA